MSKQNYIDEIVTYFNVNKLFFEEIKKNMIITKNDLKLLSDISSLLFNHKNINELYTSLEKLNLLTNYNNNSLFEHHQRFLETVFCGDYDIECLIQRFKLINFENIIENHVFMTIIYQYINCLKAFIINNLQSELINPFEITEIINKIFFIDISFFSNVSTFITKEHLDKFYSFDPLTGLPNKKSFYAKLDEILQTTKDKKTGLIILDVRRFTSIKEVLGFLKSDFLLKLIKDKLLMNLSETDYLARTGFDEFSIISQFENNEEIIEKVKQISEIFSNPIILNDGEEVTITFNFGVSIYPDHATNIDLLIENALMALAISKKQKSNMLLYSKKLSEELHNIFSIGNNLRKAIKNNEFVLYYQPKFDVKTFKITGVEALIRWNHPKKGIVLPGEFISILEETELILIVGEWVVKEACKQIQTWNKSGKNIKIAVNISPTQLKQPNFVEKITSIIDEYQVSTKNLEFEITENLLMENIDENMEKLQKIRDLGIDISVDDFGTGYSSLAYLKKLPITTLKIDLVFIKNLQINNEDKKITEAIISLAKVLNLKTISEGIETAEQLEILKTINCCEGQGFYFGRPMPVDEFENFYLLNH